MSCVHWHWIDPPCQEIGKVVERNAAGGASGDGGDQPSYGHEMPRNHRESDDDDDLEVPHCQRHFGNILVGTRSTAFLSSQLVAGEVDLEQVPWLQVSQTPGATASI